MILPVVSIHQPYASLLLPLAPGEEPVMSILTRGWPCPKSLIGQRLGIASTKERPTYGEIGDYLVEPFFENVNHVSGCYCERDGVAPDCARRSRSQMVLTDTDTDRVVTLPLGHLLGTVKVVDCVPILQRWTNPALVATGPALMLDGEKMVLRPDAQSGSGYDKTDQLPYGDYSTNGKQRYAWIFADAKRTDERCPAPLDSTYVEIDGATVCPTCHGKGTCPPIAVTGRQKIWRWTP